MPNVLKTDIQGKTFSRFSRHLPVWVFLLMVMAALYSVSQGDKPSHLFKEGRLLTQLSGMMLLLTGFTIFHIWWIRRQIFGSDTKGQSHRLWAFMGAAFVYLFIDEVGCIHEKAGDFIQWIMPGHSGFLEERFDSLVVAGYGIAAMVILSLYRREVLHYARYWRYFLGGAVCFMVMVLADFASEDTLLLDKIWTEKQQVRDAHILLELVEDFTKLLAVVYFLRGFLGIRYHLLQSRAEETNPTG